MPLAAPVTTTTVPSKDPIVRLLPLFVELTVLHRFSIRQNCRRLNIWKKENLVLSQMHHRTANTFTKVPHPFLVSWLEYYILLIFECDSIQVSNLGQRTFLASEPVNRPTCPASTTKNSLSC